MGSITKDGRYVSPRIVVRVTQEDIDFGKRRNSNHCPNAEAVRRAASEVLGETVTSVAVDLQTIRFSVPGRRLRYVYLTPRPAQTLVIDFDQGNEPKPVGFLLRSGQVTYMGSNHQATKAGEIPYSATKEGIRELHKAKKEKEKTQPKATEGRGRHKATLTHHPVDCITSIPGISGGRTPPIHKAAKNRGFGLRRFGAY